MHTKSLPKILFAAFAIFFSANMLQAQQPTIQWQKSLGGSGDEDASSIQQTKDGGYIVAGYSSSNDSEVTGNHGGVADYWVVKLDAAGTIQWQKCLGGSGEEKAEEQSIQQTTDGGYIVAGFSSSNDGDVTGNHGNSDYWIVKLTFAGTIQWQKSFGGSNFDDGYSIQQTHDSGYIVAGSSRSHDGDVTGNHGNFDYWVVKLDAAGTIQWQKSLGGSSDDGAQSIQQTTDGGYIVGGLSDSHDGDVTGNHGLDDYWIVKLTSTGTIQWQKSLGGSGNDEEQSIQQTSDGGYIVAGYSFSNDGDVTGNHGGSDDWVVKLDAAGTIQWQKSLGGSGTDLAFSIQQTTDGGYIVAGSSDSTSGNVTGNHGSLDDWIVKLDAIGTIQWQKSLGGSSDDEAHSIRQTSDGGYIVAGFTSSNNGDVTGNHGNYDYWIVKLSAGALPVTFINFDGVLHNGQALLNWSIATELNNKGFEVQKSMDGRAFTYAGFVNGHGNSSSINNFNYTDEKVLSGSNYYRLKQIDLDGKFNYSSVIRLDFAKFDWAVLGNPANNNSWIQMQLDRTADVSVQIVSMNGSLIQTINKGNISAGTYSVSLNLTGMSSGMYLVKLVVNGHAYSKRIIK